MPAGSGARKRPRPLTPRAPGAHEVELWYRPRGLAPAVALAGRRSPRWEDSDVSADPAGGDRRLARARRPRPRPDPPPADQGGALVRVAGVEPRDARVQPLARAVGRRGALARHPLRAGAPHDGGSLLRAPAPPLHDHGGLRPDAPEPAPGAVGGGADLAPRPARTRRRRKVKSEGRGRRGGELGRVRVPDRDPGEEGEETVELARHPRQADLLDEALAPPEREGVAHRVELARMEVDECRTAAAETRALRQALGPQRQDAQVEAASVWHAQRPERDRRRRHLEQHGARRGRDPGRPERRLAETVEVSAHRKEARVVAEAGGGDRIERPERVARHRPRGRAEAEHRGAELVLEEPPGLTELALDAGGVRRVEERVLEPVAGDLVAGRGDRAHQTGRAPRRARQHEEGAAPPARGEQVEDPAGRLG